MRGRPTPRPTPWPPRASAAAGCTAYVTLEPCNHSGRTEPCAKALYAAGVARVVYAQTDPNPAAAGGAKWLRRKGVAVDGGLLAAEAQALNRTWTHLVTTGPPLGDLEARDHPRRPQCGGRRDQPVDHRAKRPGPTSTSSGRGAGRSSWAPAPPCSTTRS